MKHYYSYFIKTIFDDGQYQKTAENIKLLAKNFHTVTKPKALKI